MLSSLALKSRRTSVAAGRLVSALAVLGTALAPVAADAASFTVLHTFSGPDGANPTSLWVDNSGTVYGTTENGGAFAPACAASNKTPGCGTVFKLTPPAPGQTAWTISNYFFTGPDGMSPDGIAVSAAGVIFGTANAGGTPSAADPNGTGTVFMLTPQDATRSTYDVAVFSANVVGGSPHPGGQMGLDGSGAFYFQASGDTGDRGRIVKVVPATQGSAASIADYAFSGPDGSGPTGGVIVDQAGTVYGMTVNGGNTGTACSTGCGTIYKLIPPAPGAAAGYTPQSFSLPADGSDGFFPIGRVFVDGAGIIYGATQKGVGFAGLAGTWFRLIPDATRTIYTLESHGTFPWVNSAGGLLLGGMVVDASGVVYGTEIFDTQGNSELFKLTPPAPGSTGDYTFQQLQAFSGPSGNLVIDRNGVIYGTALGSSTGCSPNGFSCGTVWAFTP
jgi:hypothetical protein